MNLKGKKLLVVGSLVLIAIAFFYIIKQRGEGTITTVAEVNGKPITSAEIDGLLLAGMTKPVAIEASIARALVADDAQSRWPKEAEAVAMAGAREALSAFYVKKRLLDLRQAISDEEISRYYETNVKDELYAGQILKYYLTQDAKDATDTAEAVKRSPETIASKFSWVNKDGDHAVMPVATPYGLYQQVKGMQPGQISGPFNVRDGLLFLKLEDRKPGKRPELSQVKEDIRAVVAQRKLDEESKQLREKANIHLR